MKFQYNTRKGSGNQRFPEWNPQAEFISAEENSEFQGVLPLELVCLFICQSSPKTCFWRIS